jgi:diguanylate cyclase (GGDEF)-like protein
MTLRILLAESDADEALFLHDVLEEMEGGEYWRGWPHVEVYDAPTCGGAETILRTEPIDIILLSLSLADAPGAEAFRRVHRAAPHVPVVALAGPAEVETAERLVRNGAQDFLQKGQIDCGPLAHAVRNAVDRQRLLMAARAAAMTDPLTGLLNRAAFQVLADRDRRIADRSGTRIAILTVDAPNVSGLGGVHAEQRRDLELVEAADRLRAMASPEDLVARIGERQFAVCVVETPAESIEAAWARFQRPTGLQAPAIGVAVFDTNNPVTLEALLAEAESRMTRPPRITTANAS